MKRRNGRRYDRRVRSVADHRYRGGISARRSRNARSGRRAAGRTDPRVRKGLGPPRHAGIPAQPDRDRHARVPVDQGGAARAVPAAPWRGRGGRGARAEADRRVHPPVRPVAAAGAHAQGTLRQAGARHAGRHPPDADLRHARACGHRRPGPARGRDEPGRLRAAAPARPVHLLAVLAGRAHGAEILPPVGVRRHAAHRHARSVRQLRRIRTAGRTHGRHRPAGGFQQNLVGHPPVGQVPDAGDAHRRRVHPAGGRAGHRRPVPVFRAHAGAPAPVQPEMAGLPAHAAA